MKRTSVRTVVAVGVALGLTAVLSGCSSSGGTSSNSSAAAAAQAAIDTAVDKSVAKGSAAVIMTTKSTKQGSKTATTQAAGLVAFDGTAGQLAMVAGNTSAVEHVGNGVLYVKISSPSLPAIAKNKWIKVKLTDTTHLTRLGVGSLPPVGSILTQLKGLGGTATNLGNVTIGGKTVTKYQVTISKTQLIANATKLFGPKSNTVAALKAVPASTHATVNVYVGSDGLIARENEELSLPVSGKATSTTTQIDLSRYGTSIPIGRPVAGSVVDVAALFSGTGGNGTTIIGN